jgi:hypothetical protein
LAFAFADFALFEMGLAVGLDFTDKAAVISSAVISRQWRRSFAAMERSAPKEKHQYHKKKKLKYFPPTNKQEL